MRPSSTLLENFIQENYYPEVNLPPLWQVIYQEAIRGHHILFQRADVERFEAAEGVSEPWLDSAFTEELEGLVVDLAGSADLQEMVHIIDDLPEATRRNLYYMYRRVLWMWRCYVKDQLN